MLTPDEYCDLIKPLNVLREAQKNLADLSADTLLKEVPTTLNDVLNAAYSRLADAVAATAIECQKLNDADSSLHIDYYLNTMWHALGMYGYGNDPEPLLGLHWDLTKIHKELGEPEESSEEPPSNVVTLK